MSSIDLSLLLESWGRISCPEPHRLRIGSRETPKATEMCHYRKGDGIRSR